MPRKFLIPLVAVIGLALLGGAGAYAYFFSGLRTSPTALALSSPTPTPTASATTSPSATSAASGIGTWQVASGSLAGYRVKEQFAGQSSSHEAVSRTSDVSGQVTITQTGGVYTMSSGKITVQLASLASVDSVAGFNVSTRDGIVQRTLDVSSYPTAVFEAGSVVLPAAASSGQQVTVTVPGQLTIHGVKKDVTATLQLRVSGGTAQIAGSIQTNMTEFGISPPQVPITVVQPAVTIEFSLNLTHSA